MKSGSTGRSEDAQLLARSLGVEAVCAGRVEQRAGSLEIVAELFAAADGSLIWRESYSTQTASLLDIESAIATAIARELGNELSNDEEAALARASTTNPAAHRLYLQGRHFWNRRSSDGFAASLEAYQAALDLDPNYALAHAGLAHTHLMLLAWNLEPPAAAAERVVAAAETAIRLDPTLAEPHAALGYLKTIHEYDWAGAREEFLRAIGLNGNYSSAHHWYAFLLMTLGEVEAAITEILLARELEPLSPIINAEVGYFYLFARRYEQALAALQSARLLDDNYRSTISYLMRAQAFLGRRDEAIETYELWRSVVGADLTLLAYGSLVLPRLGLVDEVRVVYGELLDGAAEGYVAPGMLGVLAAAIGDNDAAFRHLEAAFENGSLIFSWLRDPLLDELRRDPRYADFMRRAGLEP